MHLGNCDAYVNVAGGMKIVEPSADLSIVLAIASSFTNKPLDDKMVVFGEVGLSGEVRAVSMIEQRVSEATKLGFEVCVVPKVCYERLKGWKGSKIIPVESVRDAIELIK